MHKPNTFLYLYTFIVDHNICKHCLLVYHRQTDHIFQRSLNLKACSTYFFLRMGSTSVGTLIYCGLKVTAVMGELGVHEAA